MTTTITRRRALFGTLVLLAAAATSVDVQAEPGSTLVAFNTKSYKYHCPECEWAIKCTRNCVLVSRDVAEARGGIPCKVCQGTCGVQSHQLPTSRRHRSSLAATFET